MEGGGEEEAGIAGRGRRKKTRTDRRENGDTNGTRISVCPGA